MVPLVPWVCAKGLGEVKRCVFVLDSFERKKGEGEAVCSPASGGR